MTDLDVGRPTESTETSVQRRLDDMLRIAYRINSGDLERTKREFRDRIRYDDDAADLLWGLFSGAFDRVFGPRFARIAREIHSENYRPGRAGAGTVSRSPVINPPRSTPTPQPTADEDEPAAPSLAAHHDLSSSVYMRHIEGFQIQLLASKPKPFLDCTVRELRSYQRQSTQMARYIDAVCHGLTDEMVPGKVLARGELARLWQEYAVEETA